VVAAPEGQAQRVVAGFVGRGANFVQRQRMADATGDGRAYGRAVDGLLEVAAGIVVVRLRGRASVADVEGFGGIGRCQIATEGFAIAAIERAGFAIHQAALARRGKHGFGGFDHDAATDRVAADTDG
jgi:hypothetical protein